MPFDNIFKRPSRREAQIDEAERLAVTGKKTPTTPAAKSYVFRSSLVGAKPPPRGLSKHGALKKRK